MPGDGVLRGCAEHQLSKAVKLHFSTLVLRLERRKSSPQRLHNLPPGPFLHAGDSFVPQCTHFFVWGVDLRVCLALGGFLRGLWVLLDLFEEAVGDDEMDGDDEVDRSNEPGESSGCGRGGAAV